MKKESTLRKHIEQNGLILIAIFMVLLYWILDSMTSDQVTTRFMIAALVLIYGIFTQTLINSRKAALEEKERTQKQLIQAEKLAALGIVAAGIAHEVKNPLAVIIQGVEYLRSSLSTDELMSDVLERIKKSAFRADSIIKGLLSFTRQVPLRTESVDIRKSIEETLVFVENQLKIKNVTVIKQYPDDIPLIDIDSNQIKQVFLNILINALEAMENGGTITIGIDVLSERSDSPYLRITFGDTGCGIPQDKIEKVFDPFYTTKTTSGNSGLGLSISKGIIDKHHGSIHIESKVGEGTKVIITLPVKAR